MVLTWSVAVVLAFVDCRRIVSEIPDALPDFPELRFSGGAMYVDGTTPYRWEGEDFLFAIDPDERIAVDRPGLVLRRDGAESYQRNGMRRVVPYSYVDGMTLDGESAANIGRGIMWILAGFMALLPVFGFVWRLLVGCVLAIVLMTSTGMAYWPAFRVGLVAVTPAVVLGILPTFKLGTPPGWTLLTWAAYVGYLVWAIRITRRMGADSDPRGV